jgi:hypothetical protein
VAAGLDNQGTLKQSFTLFNESTLCFSLLPKLSANLLLRGRAVESKGNCPASTSLVPMIFFLLFVALSVFLILVIGELSMSSEEIIYTTPLAKYQMKWGEVKKVEIDLQGGGLVFYANDRNKRMAVLGPGYWSGPDRQNLAKLLSDEMEKRQIPTEQTPRAAYTMSKNTKVK